MNVRLVIAFLCCVPALAEYERVRDNALRCMKERATEIRRRHDSNGIESPDSGECRTNETLRNYMTLGFPVEITWSPELHKKAAEPEVFVMVTSPQESMIQACGMAHAKNEPDVLAKVRKAYAKRYGKALDLSLCGKF